MAAKQLLNRLNSTGSGSLDSQSNETLPVPVTTGAPPEKLHVPCDLYGLFVAEPLQISASIDGCTIVFPAMIRAFLFMALNFTVQILCIVRIHHMSMKMQGQECSHEHSYMQVVCVFMFGMCIFSELRGCMDFLELVARCPVYGAVWGYTGIGNGSDWWHGHGAMLSQWRVEHSCGCGARFANWVTRSSWTLDSMGYGWKAVCLVFVGLPRVLICCLFAKVGVGFIVRSPQIIVDTVAMLLVVNIATFIYTFFTTSEVKQQMEMVKPVECYASNTRRITSFLFVNFAYPVLLVCLSVAAVWFSRQACDEGEDFQSWLKLGDTSNDQAVAASFFKEVVSVN